MQQETNHFAQLAQQVRAGNSQAKSRIERDLEPALQRILARALSTNSPATGLHHRLRALSQQLAAERSSPEAERTLLARVVSRFVVKRLTPEDTNALGLARTCLVG